MDGNFVWYDLTTSDPAAAVEFYTKLIGWQPSDFPGAEPPYHVMSVQGWGIGGITGLAAGEPGWKGYIKVSDVDASARKVSELGGTPREAQQMEGVGRMALATDRHGARFVLFNPGSMDPPPRPDACTTGMPAWNELHGGDLASDFPFYSSLFGWEKGDGMDMGDMGTYQQFKADGVPIGGMMTKMPDMPHPQWTFYFHTGSVEAAAAKVRDLGGTVIFDPHEVPGGMWIIQCLDPQMNLFGLVSPSR